MIIGGAFIVVFIVGRESLVDHVGKHLRKVNLLLYYPLMAFLHCFAVCVHFRIISKEEVFKLRANTPGKRADLIPEKIPDPWHMQRESVLALVAIGANVARLGPASELFKYQEKSERKL